MSKISFRNLKIEIILWIEAFLRFFPGNIGYVLRRAWYKRRLNRNDKVSIGIGCEFVSPQSMNFSGITLISNYCYFNADGGEISVGNWTAFNRGVHLNASCGGKIQIGEKCPIGPGVVMRTANHTFSDVDKFIQDQGHDAADIIIEDNCWISANVIILGGVTIGTGSVIGAGAVVTNNIPPYAIAVGVPAKVIRFRK